MNNGPAQVGASQFMLGLRFDSLTQSETVIKVIELAKAGGQGLVVTPNVDHVVICDRDPNVRRIFQGAIISVLDSAPLAIYARLRGIKLPERVCGADLFVPLVHAMARDNLVLGLVGATPEVGEMVRKKLKGMLPNLAVAPSAHPPFGFEADANATDALIDEINSMSADVMVMALGTPKQELWYDRNKGRLPDVPFLGLGATLDFFVLRQRRAPLIVRRIGVEWLWRLISNPRRLGPRYMRDIVAIPRILLKYILGLSTRSERE